MRTTLVSALSGISLLLSATPALAAAPRADIQVTLQAPSSVQISTPTTYTATVKNLGPATSTNTQIVVEFPLTNTSPTVAILGNVTESESACSIASNKITCVVGSLKKGKSVSISYSYTAPVSTKVLEMKAIGSSSVADANTGNNTATVVPNLLYPTRSFTSATMENSHCTGTNLTSYFECALFPSSISTHTATFNVGGTITLSEPGYYGSWSQPSASQLFFEYFDTNGKAAEFNGYAINGSNCFDGLTTFFPQPNDYVSPYRVCIQ